MTTTSLVYRKLRWVGLSAALPALWACTSRTVESPTAVTTATLTTKVTQKINDDVDLLFMIDNSQSMTSMQQKLAEQLPTFMQVLEALPNGLPNVHIAVVSSDMGAPGDATSALRCTTSGSDGSFQAMIGPAAACTSTTLAQGATFISDVDGNKNFTDPIDMVFQCIAQLGDTGCNFEHPLASIDRALGADSFDSNGRPQPPASNVGFLRDDAYLGIILLTNEDDCSAPPNTTIYSLGTVGQTINNPDGPVANYRCNGGPHGAHRCTDPATGQMIVPPLFPPSDATGTPPRLNLTDCEDNDTGSSALTPVSQFVNDIRKLKSDPDGKIFVAAIAAPPDPYGVAWVHPDPPPSASVANELWPQVMHSCGAQGGDDVNPMATQTTTDGSFGDPAVRISQFVHGFANGVFYSVCDASYRQSMTAIATALGKLLKPSCLHGVIQKDSAGNPACAVTNHLTDSSNHTSDVNVPSCAKSGNVPPCWTLAEDTSICAAGDLALKVQQDTTAMGASSLDSTIECSLCVPGSTDPGCQ